MDPAKETKTLRDEFAMAAMQALIVKNDLVIRDPETLLKVAYDLAHAAMNERKK